MKQRKILLRFDDICPTMDWNQWGKAKHLLDKAEVKPLMGVIPDCQDKTLLIDDARDDFWDYLKELQKQGYAIAMHGYQHVFEMKADGLVTRNKISEFAGLPYEVQLQKIRKGKEIMNSHGVETDIFFAPAHSYDDNTLRALSNSGFKYVSDGLSSKPYMRYGITLLPCRSGGIPRMRKDDTYVTAVVHAHEWAREDKKVDWLKYQQLLDVHASGIVPFYDFCQWERGNALLQRIIEQLYLHVCIPVIKFARILVMLNRMFR